jgi:hypothetical protein
MLGVFAEFEGFLGIGANSGHQAALAPAVIARRAHGSSAKAPTPEETKGLGPAQGHVRGGITEA